MRLTSGLPVSTPDHAFLGSGTASVTISSWPMVSLPNSSGMQAPIVTTTAIVPKNIDHDWRNRSHISLSNTRHAAH